LVKIFYGKKNKKNIHAVDGVSFKLSPGEIFGFLGPNGAGKTTTVRILAGLLKPTSGHARIFGRDVGEIGDRIRKDIGYLCENHGNYENLTVFENLKFFGGFYDLKGKNLEVRIDEVLVELEITDRKHMKVGKLSKGLKQRAALARVLLHDPKLIFLDEPTAGLDPKAAANVRNIIKGFKSEERIIFINSHNLNSLQQMCDRVAILKEGKIMRIGTASDLSREIFGAQELIVNVKEMISSEILQKISELDFVENCRFIEDYNQLNIHLKDVDEYTPEIIEILVKKKIKILEVKRLSHSLEDIYLTLMSEPEKGGEVEK